MHVKHWGPLATKLTRLPDNCMAKLLLEGTGSCVHLRHVILHAHACVEQQPLVLRADVQRLEQRALG